MGLFRRLSTRISSSVDRAVSKVENHDAIINAVLRDTRKAAARSRVRLERLRKDGDALKTRRDKLNLDITRWTERARRTGASDETRALECLRRRKECKTQLRDLLVSIEKHDELEARITEQVKSIEARIGEITLQRNAMRSRQSVAEAMRSFDDIEGTSDGEIDDTFDRWEINVGETEILTGTSATRDLLDSTLTAEEDTAQLRAQLSELLRHDEETLS